MARIDATLLLAALAFALTFAWAEHPPVKRSYFQGAWTRANPRCAGGHETLRFEGGHLHWSDPEGHRAEARVRFRAANRLEGFAVDIQARGASNPTDCGWRADANMAVYIQPTTDRDGWVFVQDPTLPWRRAGEDQSPDAGS
ncbi:MAG: hypothetical protein KC466_16940 [Myxococcales bacterium]|nr:hypothetical protein [Myxococcales bacterium]